MTRNTQSHIGPVLYPLSLPKSAQILSLFARPHQQLVVRSVLAGNTCGDFWVDDPSQPNLAVLWDKAHHLYVTTKDLPIYTAVTIRQFLRDVVASHAIEHPSDHCIVSSSNLQTDALLKEALPDASRRERTLLRLSGLLEAVQGCRDNSLSLQPIDHTLLQGSLSRVEDLRHEVCSMWGSPEAFIRNGFGYCMAGDREIVCWCTAEYVSPGWCGIGIETIQPYQGRGLATATATAFVQHCATHDIVPHWNCWAGNAPSLRVAQKLGFEEIEQYEVYVDRFDRFAGKEPNK